MLVTDQGKIIRTTVGDIRIAGPQHPGRDDLQRRRQRNMSSSVAKIDESDEEDIELDGGDELAPDNGAEVGEDEARRARRRRSRRSAGSQPSPRFGRGRWNGRALPDVG